jgi:hypothetical protein
MGRKGKQIQRLLSSPKDYTYAEMKQLLIGLGYAEDNVGKTSGSRVSFYNAKTRGIIKTHKPHPGNVLRAYQIKKLIQALREQGVIDE